MPKGTIPTPPPFLEIRVHRMDLTPGLTALCAGYEPGVWRDRQLAGHLMRWIPEFALNHSEREGIDSSTAVEQMQQASRNMFMTPDIKKRGEFGELLLHVVIRQCFKSIPAISKIFYKDGPNETVKGFDAVHVVIAEGTMELWLGEVKFYSNISTAISHVISELKDHTKRDYLRQEFQAIVKKIDPKWPHAAKLKRLIDPSTSLDEIFSRTCLPVLLTYDSPCVRTFDRVCEAFVEGFEKEVLRHHGTFSGKKLPDHIRVHLFLLPLRSKAELQKRLHEKLTVWQSIAAD